MTWNQILTICATLMISSALLTARAEFTLKEATGRSTPTLFQVSTLDALTLGLYGGVYSIGDLKQQGDFGVGTFEGIDGEMTVLDGHFYHSHSDGTLTEEPGQSRVPFAVVTKFSPEIRFATGDVSLDQLGQEIDKHLPSLNLCYAIRVHGRFADLTTRAIPKLFPPYPSLAEAVAKEIKSRFQSIEGTLVGFRCPAWVKGINQIGYHYHFISDDRTVGGHALSFTAGPIRVEIQALRQYSIWMPEEGSSLNVPLPISR